MFISFMYINVSIACDRSNIGTGASKHLIFGLKSSKTIYKLTSDTTNKTDVTPSILRLEDTSLFVVDECFDKSTIFSL